MSQTWKRKKTLIHPTVGTLVKALNGSTPASQHLHPDVPSGAELQQYSILVIEYSLEDFDESSSNRINHAVLFPFSTTCSRNVLSTGVSKATLASLAHSVLLQSVLLAKTLRHNNQANLDHNSLGCPPLWLSLTPSAGAWHGAWFVKVSSVCV